MMRIHSPAEAKGALALSLLGLLVGWLLLLAIGTPDPPIDQRGPVAISSR